MARRRSSTLTPLLIVALLLAAAGWWLATHWHRMPWQPLDMAAPVDHLTLLRIGRLHDDAVECRAKLAGAQVGFAVAPVVTGGPGCGFANGVILTGTRDIAYRPSTPMSCPAAVGLALWERQTLAPEARLLFSARIVSIETLGTYNCRRIGGGESGRLSEHASANAIDIAAFRLSDGTRISVLDDWQGDGPKATFLRRVRNGACGSFATVLSPDYNAAHRDHFHFDQAVRGGWSVCR